MALDLRTGRPVWLIDEEDKPGHPPLLEDISAEIVVIGGGISGALISNALANSGRKVVLVDSRGIGAGSTSASTAILSYETDINLSELIKNIGEQDAVRVFQAGIEAIDNIEELSSRLGEGDFKRIDSIYFASNEGDSKNIKEEYEARKKHGFDVSYLDREAFLKLFPFDAPCAILSPNAAEIDPVKFTRALIRDSEKKGLKVFGETKIKKYNRDVKEPSAITEKGNIIRAKHFVFASGYETQQFLKQKSVKLLSSYAIASMPVKDFTGWNNRGTIWESARPYVYLRTTPDDKIIIGGEDVDFVDEEKRDALLADKAETLEKKFRAMFPQIKFELSAAWTGTFAESDDSLPYIGVNKDFPGAYFALGYGGNGTTFAAMASRIICDLIEGKENSDARIFKFDR